MEYTRKIELHCREVKKDKTYFIVSTAELNGEWYKIKFTKNCENTPKNRGLYELTIDLGDCSIQDGKEYTTKDGEIRKDMATVWVRNVISLRKYSQEEMSERNREYMERVFGY